MSELTNTHFYDGKLGELKAFLEPDLLQTGQRTAEEKLAFFQLLRTKLPRTAHRNFDIVVQDFIKTGRTPGPNYDPTNNLYADDLLYLCGSLAQNFDWDPILIDLLAAQFIEMSTGMCAQGRTHRLFQVLWAFRENPPQ